MQCDLFLFEFINDLYKLFSFMLFHHSGSWQRTDRTPSIQGLIPKNITWTYAMNVTTKLPCGQYEASQRS